ncbi:MAG: hypothetical protein VYE22_24440 [Myxococcota bacterium]|nr:hypothetical protein [Myxococcota bacterium]
MRTRFILSALFTLAAAGCDCGGPTGGDTCTSNADCEADQVCVDAVCEARPDAGEGGDDGGGRMDTGLPVTLTGVRVEPASVELVSADGARPTQDFEVVGEYSDGSELPLAGPVWELDNVSIGLVDVASGLFTANGAIGGTSMVTATVPNPTGGPALVGTASIRVRLERTLVPAEIPDAPARFDAATPVDDAARAAEVVYPLDQVVMPQNVYPADVQWMRGAAGDLFRVTLTKPDVTVVAYVAFDGDNHWLVESSAWRAVAQTNPDDPASLTVDRLEAASGEVVRGAPLGMTFARAALTGSVYYWDIERGRIVRIDDGTATRVEFMPDPPQGCVGCHSVSPSGRYMAGRFGGGDNFGSVLDLTTDLTASPAPTLWSPNRQYWWFSSWSPDESRLVVARVGGNPTLALLDPMTGDDVPVTGSMPNGTYPSWSPDGTQIAYVGDQNGWGDRPTRGNVYVLPISGDAVGTPTRIHEGASVPGATTDSYPTWAPDASMIAFANGDGARSESSSAALRVMAPDGSGDTALATAASTGLDYQPSFSPFHQGGYYWLSFLSRRVYGNPQIGNSTRPATRMQQIWVTAIRDDAAPGTDPSSVPYWLPGQNTQSANISAYWAPRACRPDGESCSVGTECCGGDCRPPAGGGDPVCSPPPPDRCRNDGETCSTDADCCEGMGLTCLANVCVAGPG